MSWLDKLGENIKYAHTVNNLGHAYAVTSQAKEDLREQGKEEEAREIEKAEAIGTVGGAIAGLTLGKGVPALMRGVKAFRAAHPIISGAIDAGLTVDGVRNALSDNGVEKTINYIKGGNWGRAAASGTMDALDLLGGVGLVGDAGKLIKKGMDWHFINKIVPEHIKARDFIFSEIVPGRNLPQEIKKDLSRRLSLDVDRYRISFGDGLSKWLYINGYATASGKIRYNPLTPNVGATAVHEGMHQLLFASDELYPMLYATINPVTKSIEYKRLGEPISTPMLLDYLLLGIGDFDRLNTQAKALPIRVKEKPAGTIDIFDANSLEWKEVPTSTMSHGLAVTKANDAMERDATVLQILYSISQKHNGAKGLELTHIIENMPLWKLNWELAIANGYGTDYWINNLINRVITPITRKQQGLYLKDALLMRKSGGTIHIKKKNKGKFTDYCGGKVTEECIRKGKNSSNPTTRKRANFAWVARHKFKHADGNKINYLNIFQ